MSCSHDLQGRDQECLFWLALWLVDEFKNKRKQNVRLGARAAQYACAMTRPPHARLPQACRMSTLKCPHTPRYLLNLLVAASGCAGMAARVPQRRTGEEGQHGRARVRVEPGLRSGITPTCCRLNDPASLASQVPRQRNGCDCGVFALMAANYLAIDRPFDYQQVWGWRAGAGWTKSCECARLAGKTPQFGCQPLPLAGRHRRPAREDCARAAAHAGGVRQARTRDAPPEASFVH